MCPMLGRLWSASMVNYGRIVELHFWVRSLVGIYFYALKPVYSHRVYYEFRKIRGSLSS